MSLQRFGDADPALPRITSREALNALPVGSVVYPYGYLIELTKRVDSTFVSDDGVTLPIHVGLPAALKSEGGERGE
ncbi:hypothetical protein [Prescottella agglutinans]|uniref:Uncharacterized protein n=1 Tax=Prescottella agglutinans TaxID=1644129 RepID=A0ABT6M5B0_9NOCA|nr:hypothetical protein [Prescottella agglutinans]MDH6279508.1 hypothetical protein [Prescottella agglutinans]